MSHMENETLRSEAQRTLVRAPTASDVGPACLAAVLRYYGGHCPLERLQALSGTDHRGTTLLGLHQAAQELGLEAGAYEADLDSLKALEAPCILHVTSPEGQQRFVVCYGFERKRFVLGDPAAGVREYSPTKLQKIWQSRALLLLKPTADFLDKTEQAAREAEIPVSSPEASVRHDTTARYRCFDVDVAPFGRDHLILHSRRSGRTRILPAPAAQLLLSLDRFETLHDHAAGLLQKTKAAHQKESSGPGWADWKAQLAAFAEEGFLVSEAELRTEVLACAAPADAPDDAPPITTLGIPTRNRTESLHRALTSFIENAERHGRRPTFVVMDNSETPDAGAQNRQALQALNQSTEATLAYADRERRARFAAGLARRAGVAPEIVRFALLGDERCRGSYGASRNALLLHTAGTVSLQVDDDTICRLAKVPASIGGLSLTSQADANEYWFFASREDALAAFPPAETNFLGLHEQLLGRPVADCIAALAPKGEALHLDHLEAPFLENLGRPEARVLVSFAGVLGDSGMTGYLPRLFYEGATFERLAESGENYPVLLRTRQLLRAPARPAISDGPFCMTINIGLDNRGLLPPFMPVQRNEDGVFGAVLKTCYKDAFRGYLPEYALLHAPPERRPNPQAPIGCEPFRTNDLLLFLIMSFALWPQEDPARRLPALGGFLQDLGASAPKAFAERTRSLCYQSIHAQVSHVQRLLKERADAPREVREDLQTYLAAARAFALREDLAVPADLDGSPSERQILFQELVTCYGAMLQHWPALVAAAKELREEGTPLAAAL